MFVFGSQYYRAPTPLQRDWETDLKMAKEHHFNTLRSWVLWNWQNPKEGVYDFSNYEKLLDLCAKNDLKMIMLFNLEGCPAWMQRKYPEAIFIDKNDGKHYIEQTVNVAGGGYPGLCYHHDSIRAEARTFIKTFAGHFKDHPAIFGWEPINECQIEPSRHNVNDPFCYCAGSIKKFQEWLKQKYHNDIHALNEFWHDRFGDFEDVNPPRIYATYANWIDWRLFAVHSLAGWFDWRARAIKEGDPNHPVLAHATSQAAVAHNLAIEASDDWGFQKEISIYGVASFPSKQGMIGIGMGLDIARKSADGKEYWMAEMQADVPNFALYRDTDFPSCEFCGTATKKSMVPSDKSGRGLVGEPVTAERQSMWTWTSMAHGAKGVLYWQFKHEMYGFEYDDGLVSLDGTPSRTLKVVGEIARFIQDREELFKNAQYQNPEIAIGFGLNNYIMTYAGNGCVDPIRNAVRGVYNTHWQLDYPVDFVRLDEEFIDETYEKYKVLYLPFPTIMTPKAREKVKKFVWNGGTLISEASLCQYDESGFATTRIPGFGFDEVFGCRREKINSLREFEFEIAGKKIKTGFYKEILKPTTGKVIGTFDGNEPAVVENTYGNGRTIYIGSNPFMYYVNTLDANLLEVIKNVFNQGVVRKVYTDKTNILARCLTSKDQKLVYLINTSAESQDAEMTVNFGFNEVQEIYQKKPVHLFKTENGSLIKERMANYETRIYIFK